MKKITVLVVAVIYAASIVVVGIFGVRALMYTEMVFVEDIVLADNIKGVPITPATDGKGYTVVLKYEENLNFPLEYTPIPADATLRNEIKASIIYQTGSDEDPCAVYDRGMILFRKRGQITVFIESQDGGKVSKELRILAI